MRVLLALFAVASLVLGGCGKIKSVMEAGKKAKATAEKALEEAEKLKAEKEAVEEEAGEDETGEVEEKGAPSLTEEEVKTVVGLMEKDPAFKEAPFDLMSWAIAYSKDKKKYDALLKDEGLDKKAYSRLLRRLLKARFGEQTLGIHEAMKEGYAGIDAKKTEAEKAGVGPEDLKKFDEAKVDMEAKIEELKP